LNKLVESGKLEKLGRPHRVFYKLGLDTTSIEINSIFTKVFFQKAGTINYGSEIDNYKLKLFNKIESNDKYFELLSETFDTNISTHKELGDIFLILDNFIYITLDGKLSNGVGGFVEWCNSEIFTSFKNFCAVC